MRFTIWLFFCVALCASWCFAQETVDDNVGSDEGSESGASSFVQEEYQSGFNFRPFDGQQNSNRASSGSEHNASLEEEAKLKQAEAVRQRKLEGRKEEGEHAVRRTIHAASSDTCDWRSQPVAFIKGEVCGSHYKVLGIDRKSKLTDKTKVKKKFRQLSLQLHPDKNPSPEANEAFSALQGAYDCLLDDSCKEDYDNRLALAEQKIAENRQRIKRVVMEKTIVGLNKAHYYVSLAANRIYQLGLNFWDVVGEWQVTMFDETYPVGRPLAILMLLWKGQFLLKIHALSYLIIRVNYEIAKARGWL